MALEVVQFLCLEDNYGYLIHDPASGATAAIDTPDPEEIKKQLAAKGATLTHILNTHHHWDHTQGNEALKAETGCTIVGPAIDKDRIPGIDETVAEGTPYQFGEVAFTIFETPGHTSGHIAFYAAAEKKAFVGDTLFSLGCGRLFEGTPEQMWESLTKLLTMEDDTQVYCGHEYTQSNARFALTVDPTNEALKARAEEVEALRAAGQPTVPTTLALEKSTNPFLRPGDSAIRTQLGLESESDARVFAEIRHRKDIS